MTDSTDARNRILSSLGVADGKGTVRMQDRFDTHIDDLWSAFTDPKRLLRWLGEFDGDLRPGGQFRARFLATEWAGTGSIDVCEPPRRLRLRTIGTDESDEHVIEATFTSDGNHTVLVVEERGMPIREVAGYGTGMQIHVEDLIAHLNGRERCTPRDRMAELFPTYQALAADMH